MWMNQFVWDKDKEPKIMEITNREEFAATTTYTEGGMFADSFRYFYPDQKEAYTNWHTLTNARDTNYGCRLDYIYTDSRLAESDLTDCNIMAEVMGSDHCPVKAEYSAEFIKCEKCPGICTKYMPEFTGKQQKLSSFFVKRKSDQSSQDSVCEEILKTNNSDSNDGRVTESKERTNTEQSESSHAEKNRKRPLPMDSNSLSSANPLKKRKSDNNASKQANLMNFFAKPKTKNPDSEKADKEEANIALQGKERVEAKVDTGATCVENNESQATVTTKESVKLGQTSAWKNLLKGPPPAPLCKGHKEPSVLRTVKKPGPNKGKQFFVCCRGEGASNNPEARCDFFQWVDNKKR